MDVVCILSLQKERPTIEMYVHVRVKSCTRVGSLYLEEPVGKEAGRCNRNERKKATLPNRWTDRFRNVGKLAFRRYHSNNSNAWCRSGRLDAGGTREIRVCCILITFRNRDIRLKILTIVAFTFRLGPRSRASPGRTDNKYHTGLSIGKICPCRSYFSRYLSVSS